VLDLGVSEEGDGSIVALSINVASSKSKGVVELKQKLGKQNECYLLSFLK
jgi:hypothetical protein